jgi:hypothetical protein
MAKRLELLGFLTVTLAFVLLNRASYQGYFHDDELDNISWTSRADPGEFIRGFLTPRFLAQNFRPVGHAYFYLTGSLFHLRFPPYVATLQAFHLLNVLLLALLLQRLGAPPPARLAACAFFALHMALFDAVWKPMYIFDVLCATFCLLSLLAWTRQRWIWSFLCFWLAYKSKELAVMLPMVFVCYEWWFGKRRWKALAPFFLVSLSFGIQALLQNSHPANDYTLSFTPATLARTATFYAGRMFLVPYLGFALPLAAIVWPSRRLWFGLAMMVILFLPLLLLPGRVYPAYCYLPFLGLALAISAFDLRVTIPLLILWTPLELRELRAQRRATLTLDDQVRSWVAPIERIAPYMEAPSQVVCSGHIAGFAPWGVAGALDYLFKHPGIVIRDAHDADAQALMARGVPVLVWNPGYRRLTIERRTPQTADAPRIVMTGAQPLWQLTSGWHDLEGQFRWTDPDAAARLARPESARRFELTTVVVHPVTVRVVLNGVALAPHTFSGSGWQTAGWELAPAPSGPVQVEFHCDSQPLGMAVGSFGFTGPP